MKHKPELADLHFVLSDKQLVTFRDLLFSRVNMRLYHRRNYQRLFDSVITTLKDMGYRIVKQEHLPHDRQKNTTILG